MGKTELKIAVDSDLLAEATAAGISVERLTEQSLRRALAETERYRGLSEDAKASLWAEENAAAIEAQRQRIDAFGVFGEDLRTW